MALALPFLQFVLKVLIIPNAPLLNFMRALAYGYALAGVLIILIFAGWLLSDKSHGFSVMVPALCMILPFKPVSRAAHLNCSYRASWLACWPRRAACEQL